MSDAETASQINEEEAQADAARQPAEPQPPKTPPQKAAPVLMLTPPHGLIKPVAADQVAEMEAKGATVATPDQIRIGHGAR